MYPEDRVLVAIVTSPRDYVFARDRGWYRIPQSRAPKGVHAEYLAFYFNRSFGEQKWAIHTYGRILGHELVRRRDLLPEELDHPRAAELYYKIQLASLQRLDRPIVSLRWRRISFIHTTWDRFTDAAEINDLFIEGETYVDRIYYALREAGIFPEREYQVKEGDTTYRVDLAIPCRAGTVAMVVGDRPRPESAFHIDPVQAAKDPAEWVGLVEDWIRQSGGECPKAGQK